MTNQEIATLISERIGDRPVPFESVRATALEIYTLLGGTEDDEHFDDIYQILLETLTLARLVAVIDDNDVSTCTTWSSSKIVSELANAGFDVQVVQELPATGEAHTLYFVPSADPHTQNVYDEYLYANNEWEQVGSTAVDMSDYYTADEVDALLDDKTEIVEITQAEYDALSTEEKNNGKIYSITDAVIVDMNDYYTKTEADTTFNPYNTTTAYSGYNFPKWNARGQITGRYAQAYLTSQSINGTSRSIYGSSYTTLPTIYAPTTAGTQGYYLVSNGSGAPVWKALEVASDYVISDADAIAGTYSTGISGFYNKTISEGVVQGVQIKITEDYTDSEYSVTDVGLSEIITANTYFALKEGDSACVININTSNIESADSGESTGVSGPSAGDGDGSDGSYLITINSDGTITDETGSGTIEAVSDIQIPGYFVYKCSVDINADGELYLNGEGGMWSSVDGLYLVSVSTVTTTADSYYLPSSSRIYSGNVELWLMTTADGVTWENIHYLITGDSITRTVTTGNFGPVNA